MLAVILLVIKFARGFLGNMAVLIGIAVGYVATIALGWTDFRGFSNEPWVRIVLPLQFGMPTFYLVPCLTMCLVMTIVFIEATGMFLALGAMTGRKVEADDITRGLRADSLGTLIGGMFNTFPYVSYSQNIGLVGVTGVYSRWVCVTRRRASCWSSGLVPKAGVHRRVGAAMRAGRRGVHHVRHGGGDRHQDPGRRGLRRAAPQRAGRRDLDRLRHDPDRLAELLPHHARRR